MNEMFKRSVLKGLKFYLIHSAINVVDGGLVYYKFQF